MERSYRSLLLTNEWETVKKAAETGLHIVPCLPLVFACDENYTSPDRKIPSKEETDEVIRRFLYVLEDISDDLMNADEDYLNMIDARLCGYPMEILRTERCIVREITTEDIPKLYEIYKEPDITKYMEDLYEDRDEEIKYTKDYIKWHYGLYGFGMWIVTDADGRITGRAGFDMKEEKEPYLGFMIRKDEQRRGLAYEVCTALLEYAKRHIGATGIRSIAHKDNKPSAALLNKLGFIRKWENGDMEEWYYPLADGKEEK